MRDAVSIDQTLLMKQAESQDFKECSFPRVHSDVGDGYPETDSSVTNAVRSSKERGTDEMVDWLEKWGMSSLKVNASFMQMDWKPQAPDRSASWELYIEMITRITTQPLSVT